MTMSRAEELGYADPFSAANEAAEQPRDPGKTKANELGYADPFSDIEAQPKTTKSGPDIMERVGAFAKDVYKKTVTKDSDFPELRSGIRVQDDPELKRLANRLLVARIGSTEDIKDIIRENYPGARFIKDSQGNEAVRIPGVGDFVLNEPGITEQDVASFTTDAGVSLLPGAGGAKIGAAAGRATGRVIGGGLGAAGGSLVMDAVAQSQGAKQGFDYEGAIIAGGAQVGLDVLLRSLGAAGRAIAPLLPRMLGNRAYVDAAGALTERGREAVKSVGIDPDKVSPEVIKRLERAGRDDPAFLARKADAEGLPAPIQLRAGQAMQDRALYTAEKEAVAGTQPYNDATKTAARASEDAQQDALNANKGIIASRLGGAEAPRSPGEGAAQVQESLTSYREKFSREIDAAYKAARDSGDAFIAGQDGRVFIEALERRFKDKGFGKGSAPTAYAALQRFKSLSAEGGVTRFSLKGMEAERRRMVRDAESVGMSNPADAKAIRDIIKQYDSFVGQMLKNDLLSGVPQAVELWKGARDLRARYGRIFEQNDIVNTLTSRMKDGSQRLSVEPEEAIDYIFGRSAIGAKKGLARDIRKLKEVLGDESPEWGAIKEEAFNHLFVGQKDELTFPAQRYAANLQQALRKKSETMRAIFSESEIDLMEQLSRTALAVSRPPKIVGDPNPSGSARTIAVLMDKVAGLTGPFGDFIQQTIDKLLLGPMRAGGANREMRGQIRGRAPRPESAVPTSATLPVTPATEGVTTNRR